MCFSCFKLVQTSGQREIGEQQEARKGARRSGSAHRVRSPIQDGLDDGLVHEEQRELVIAPQSQRQVLQYQAFIRRQVQDPQSHVAQVIKVCRRKSGKQLARSDLIYKKNFFSFVRSSRPIRSIDN